MAWCGDTFRDKNVHLICGQKKENYLQYIVIELNYSSVLCNMGF